MKSGLIRWQLPATTWDNQPLASFLSDPSIAGREEYAEYRRSCSPKFFFSPQTKAGFRPLFEQWDTDDSSPLGESEDIGNGFVRFFSNERVNVGSPPQWHTDPLTRHSFPMDCHWSQISDFAAGDIKLVWEINRFGFVFSLVRSYWRTGDERSAQLFWQLVEDWFQANPPETGVNWKCGQEISLRVMAWCFGLYGFGSSGASTPARVMMLSQMIAVSGRRIESNIGYALSQQNNHGLSEATGLWTIGALFPEFTDSARWKLLGRRLLESQATELIYDDGAFSQHSMNYHRVMLHDYLWSIRLGDVLEQPFSDTLRNRISLAGEFVYQLQDELSGSVPCYGQDDGALILPLNNCDYQDYRPVVQATHFLATGRHRFETGRWDEDLLWLFGTEAIRGLHVDGVAVDELKTPAASSTGQCRPEPKNDAFGTNESNGTFLKTRTDFDAREGGYATLRSPSGFALTRAARFRHRPAQADMLHVDIWWRGQNIAIDPGSYSYNALPPWDNRFAHTSYHNTVTVDGKDQMERASRFIWLPWLKGTSYGRSVPCQGDASCWNGEHDGYHRLSDPMVHRRGVVRIGDDHWLIVDSLCGQKPHSFDLHWLLLDAPFEYDDGRQILELQSSVGTYRVATAASISGARFEVIRGAADSAIGWRSRFYHDREPAISLSLKANGASVVFATVLGPDAQSPVIDQDSIHVHGKDWNAKVKLNLAPANRVPLIAAVDFRESIEAPVFSTTSQNQPFILDRQQCTFC